jgi:PAS domain S-box-containing protein
VGVIESEESINDQKVIRALSLIVVGFSLLVLVGWVLQLQPLTALLPGFATMKANTAVALALLGLASYLRTLGRLAWSRGLAALVLFFAVLTAIQILFNIDLGFDQLLVKDTLSPMAEKPFPGRMSPPTVLSVILISTAMLLNGVVSDRVRQWLIVAVLLLALSVFLTAPFDLVYGTSLFTYTGMSVYTSLILIMLAVLLLLEMPDRGWLGLLLANNPLADNTRSLLATALLGPFLLGWAFSYAEEVGWMDSGLARSTYAVTVMLLMAVVVVLNAIRLQHAETEHKLLLSDFASTQQRLQVLVENSPAAIFIKNVDGRYQLVNSHFERLVSKPRSEILGKKAEVLFAKDLLPSVLESDRRVLETKQVVITEISTQMDGEPRTYLNTKFPMLGEGGQVVSIGGIWTDISDQKNLSVSLERKNTDLERSNQELEQFAYVASHDLQEPLRMVSSYMQLLESRYNDKLDADGKEFIAYAVDGAARMQRLIQDLLAFSRVGTRGKPPEVVEANKAVTDAIQNLKVRIEENEAVVTHDELPALLADPNQLTQLFQNLIGNAIKFKSEDKPRIEITTRDRGAFAEFAVKDNGIGFDQKHADRIFVIFQRLNNRAQYDGTGIGLAICKKIVERHGGKIWVETQPGKGSTFFFTFPRPASDVVIEGAADDAQAITPREDETVAERAGRLI